MIRTTFKLCVVFSIVSSSLADINARKYSLEQEAMKLYGQDFQTVLKRFRRTPDYLKILQDKLADIKTSTKEVGLQIFHFTHGKMQGRVNEILPSSTMAPFMGIARDGKQPLYFRSRGIRRQINEVLEPSTDVPEKESPETPENKIEKLDNYKVFFSELSVAERNSMKELGFELAGSIIHTMFENLDVPQSDKYTEAPEERGAKMSTERSVLSGSNVSNASNVSKVTNVSTTTVHPKKHEVHRKSTKPLEAETETNDLKTTASRSVFNTTTIKQKNNKTLTTAEPAELADPPDSTYSKNTAVVPRPRLNKDHPRNSTHTIYIM